MNKCLCLCLYKDGQKVLTISETVELTMEEISAYLADGYSLVKECV